MTPLYIHIILCMNYSHGKKNGLFSCVANKKLLSCCMSAIKKNKNLGAYVRQTNIHPVHLTQSRCGRHNLFMFPQGLPSTQWKDHVQGISVKPQWEMHLADNRTGACWKSHCLLNHLRVSLKRSNKPSLGLACSPYIMGCNVLQCKALQQYN